MEAGLWFVTLTGVLHYLGAIPFTVILLYLIVYFTIKV